MKIKFNESSLPQTYSVDCENKHQLMISESFVENMFKTTFSAIAQFLSLRKHSTDDAKVALIVKDIKNQFKAAAIVQHVAGGDESEDSGNFSIVFTFNEADLEGIEEKYDIFDASFVALIAKIALSGYNFSFCSPTFVNSAVNLVFETIKKYLDTNTGDEPVDLELDGFFIASGAIEDGEKVFSITPGEHIKTIIKDDAALKHID